MNRLTALLVLITSCACFAQQKDFQYKRMLPPVTQQGWYALTLPAEVFKNIQPDYADLRVVSITGQDTLEVPYILAVKEDEATEEVVQLREINKSRKDDKLYVTFELPKGYSVNYINLDIEEKNFDAYVTLEGSTDQHEWFEIIKQQRILSIQNDPVDFSSTILTFPETSYRFLRAQVENAKPLTLLSASFRRTTLKPGTFVNIDLQWNATQNKSTRQTVIDITFNQYQPVNKLTFDIPNEVDYYRAFTVEVLRDSAQTPKGWTYYYNTLYNGYLTSIDNNAIAFPATLAKKLRVTINNADNPPLTIRRITASSPQVQLIMRLNAGDNYFFLYGGKYIEAPSYDLMHFKDHIPDSATVITPQTEEYIGQPETHQSPLFENKLWLWAAMALVIAILGFFTLKMMKNR